MLDICHIKSEGLILWGRQGVLHAMKRVLYIGAGAPWAVGAGYLVRQMTTLRALARVANLHLALFDFPQDAGPAPFKCAITPMKIVRRPERSRVEAGVSDMLNALPRLVRGIDLESTRRPLAEVEVEGFDAVVAYRIDFAHCAGMLGRENLVLDVDDPEHLRWRRRMAAEGKRMDWRTARDLEKLRLFEEEAVAGAAQAWVCQESDRAAFSRGKVAVVPNGVHVPALRERAATGPVAVFLGNFAGGAGSPNADALVWFLSEIWPRIAALVAGAQCRIVGNMSQELRAVAAAVRGVKAVGFAASLAEAFANTRMSVAPLRFGTGTRIKIIDAWAQGCPVVSTTAGADGLAVKDGENVLLAENAEAFAERCVELLRDVEKARRIGEAGWRTAAATYDSAKIEEGLVEWFREFLNTAPLRPAM